MNKKTLVDLHTITDFTEMVNQTIDSYDEVFIFWDLNETLLNPKMGLNLKVVNSNKYIEKLARNLDYRTQKDMIQLLKEKYYQSDLGKIKK